MTADKYPNSPGYAKGSVTSKAAADSMKPSADTIRKLVWNRISELGDHGSTCDEAEIDLNLSHQTCSARFTELHLSGNIEKDGKLRPTRSGRNAAVYIAIHKK